MKKKQYLVLLVLPAIVLFCTCSGQKKVKWDYEADVVVIGAGGAGLPAALKAKQDGADVLLVEANYDCGGHAAVSEGQLHSGGSTSSQQEWGIEDSADLYYYDHTRGSLDSRYNSREYTRSVANSMHEAYEFILKNGVIVQNIEPMVRSYYRDNGYDADGVARMTYVDASKWQNDITGTKNNGIGVTRPLEESLRKSGARFLMNYHMDVIYRESDGGKVLGVQASYTPHSMPGESAPLTGFFTEGNITSTKKLINVRARKAVIIATGGSIGDENFRTMIDPRLGPEFDGLAGMPFSDQDGSGERAAMKVGASLGSIAGYISDLGASIVPVARMGCQYGYGNGFNEKSKVWKLFRSRGIVPDYSSLIMVNMVGQRCGNEDLCSGGRALPKSYQYFSTALNSVFIDRDGDGNAECYGGPLWAVFDQAAADRNDWDMETAVDYKAGYAFKADTVEELAKAIVNKYYEDVKMDPAVLVDTIKRYNQFVVNGKDDDWGKTTLNYKIEKGPFYACWATPNLHDTLAGLRTNEDMQVIDLDGNVIPALFAAGESSGGMHVHGLGRVITSGYIAGRSAASVDKNGIATAETALKSEYAGPETNYRTKTDKAAYFSIRGASPATMTNSEKQAELQKRGMADGASRSAVPQQTAKATAQKVAAAGNTYIGTSDKGMGGAVQVQIAVENGRMTDVQILKQNETHGIGDAALEKLVKQAMVKQSSHLDAVTGATITSSAFSEALSKARAKAGLK
jgi:urocanate reductase